MSRVYLSVVVFIIVLAIPVDGHARRPKNADTITFDPVSLVFNMLGAEYQMNLDRRSAISARGGLYFWNYPGWKSSGISVGAGYRRYLRPTAPNGLYWMVDANAVLVSASYDVWKGSETTSGLIFGPGAYFGWAKTWRNGLYVDGRLGAAYYLGGMTVRGTDFPFGGFSPVAAVGVGYNF